MVPIRRIEQALKITLHILSVPRRRNSKHKFPPLSAIDYPYMSMCIWLKMSNLFVYGIACRVLTISYLHSPEKCCGCKLVVKLVGGLRYVSGS